MWNLQLFQLFFFASFICFSIANNSEAKDSSNQRESSHDTGILIPNMMPLQSSFDKQHEALIKEAETTGARSNKLIKVDIGFVHAFVASLSVIIVSELGDKTFFIAAIMSMRHSRTTVFAGAIAALALMTVLSALLGYATTVIPRWLTYYVSCALFAIFGIKMLKEAYTMDANEAQDEYEEVQLELRKKEEEVEKQGMADLETGVSRLPQRRVLFSFFSRVFLQSFTLTFLAEWGDRSQIATIILAARDEVVGVILGGILGHALCTSLAVIGGRCIAQHISIKSVHFIGGMVFIIFALSAFFIDPEDH